MVNETDFPSEQSNDSLPPEEHQSSDLVQSENEALRAENEDLKSRIGSLVQKSGEEKAKIEEQYIAWAGNIQDWYENELKKREKTIEKLEERFLDSSDAEGAKIILEERKAREIEERNRKEALEEEQRLRRTEVQNAIERAVRSFEGVTAEDLKHVRLAEDVWSEAARLYKEKSEAAMNSRFEEFEKRFERLAPSNEDEYAERERREQEDASRTPGTPRGGAVSGAKSRRQQELEARLNELERALEETKRDKRRKSALADSFALGGEIRHVRRQLEQEMRR